MNTLMEGAKEHGGRWVGIPANGMQLSGKESPEQAGRSSPRCSPERHFFVCHALTCPQSETGRLPRVLLAHLVSGTALSVVLNGRGHFVLKFNRRLGGALPYGAAVLFPPSH